MRDAKKNDSTTKISREIFKILIKSFPPREQSKYLEDIVYILIDALTRGILYVSFDEKNPPSIQLDKEGWPDKHYQALLESDWVNIEDSPMKLVGNKLSWQRWYCEMNNTTEDLIQRSKVKLIEGNDVLTQTKSITIEGLNKKQESAVHSIFEHNVVLLSGGPGTGKTKTIIEMLVQILKINPRARIGVAAPTGKATRRLQEALQENPNFLKGNYRDKLPQIKCRTLHSWLGARPGGFSRNKRRQINLDLLVIDEMSMVDLLLMKAILNAVPTTTKLILVGDRDQLPPVGSGAIWQELQEANIRKRFGNGVIHLEEIYRNRGEIASLSKVITEHGLETFWATLRKKNKSSNVKTYYSSNNNLPPRVITCLVEHKETLLQLVRSLREEISYEINPLIPKELSPSETIEKLFDCLDNLLVLCPRRNGPWSVSHIHQIILGNKYDEGLTKWPEGTPVMCSQNQPELGLSNGDIGIIIGEKDARRILFRVFADNQKFLFHLLSPSRLKKIDPAFALTIHKSQGSEANKVLLLWPNAVDYSPTTLESIEENETLNEKLIYTAITRAKENLELNTMI